MVNARIRRKNEVKSLDGNRSCYSQWNQIRSRQSIFGDYQMSLHAVGNKNCEVIARFCEVKTRFNSFYEKKGIL